MSDNIKYTKNICIEELEETIGSNPSKERTLNSLVREAHSIAKSKGWWDEPRESGTLHMLMVSEIAEATEEVRKGNQAVYMDEDGKLQGEAIELADCLIRIADYFGHKGWDLEAVIRGKMEYNITRSYKHGGKKF